MTTAHASLAASTDAPTDEISIDLRGPRLRIRRAQPEDAAASYRWFANPEVTTFLPLAGKAVLPIENINAYLTRVATSDRPDLAVTIERLDQGPIGCGGFRNVDADASCAVLAGRRWGGRVAPIRVAVKRPLGVRLAVSAAAGVIRASVRNRLDSVLIRTPAAIAAPPPPHRRPAIVMNAAVY